MKHKPSFCKHIHAFCRHSVIVNELCFEGWKPLPYMHARLFPLAHFSELCYRPQTKLRKGNVFTPVCQSLCSQGGLPQCMLGYTPPPRADTPHPLGRHPLPQQTATAADVRYASYWNAFLLKDWIGVPNGEFWIRPFMQNIV